jgi:hypothetical protein
MHTCLAGPARVPREEVRAGAGARTGEGGERASLSDSDGGGKAGVDGSWTKA